MPITTINPSEPDVISVAASNQKPDDEAVSKFDCYTMSLDAVGDKSAKADWEARLYTLPKLRARHGMSQADLAEKIGVSSASIWQWERKDPRALRPMTLYHLQKVFNQTEIACIGKEEAEAKQMLAEADRAKAAKQEEMEKEALESSAVKARDSRLNLLSDILRALPDLSDEDMQTLWRIIKVAKAEAKEVES